MSDPDRLKRVHSLFKAFNEVVRTEGDLLAWEQEWFDLQAEYRPIEDRDWFREPHAITRSIARWIETWGVGAYRITPEHILEFGDEACLVTAQNSDRAETRAGESPAPAVTLRMRLPIFVRVAAREVHPLKAYREGWVEVEGDFGLAARFNVMFGLSK